MIPLICTTAHCYYLLIRVVSCPRTQHNGPGQGLRPRALTIKPPCLPSIPANSPGFCESLQVFHQISRSPGWSTKSPGKYQPWLFFKFFYGNHSNAVGKCCSNWETSGTFGRPSGNFRRVFRHCQKWHSYNAKISRRLQIFVLWGLAGMP